MYKIKKSVSNKITIVAFFAIVFFCGYLFGHRNLILENNFTPKLISRELAKPKEVDFSGFWNVWSELENNSLHKLDPKNAITNSIKGLVASLDDPFSSFLTKDETKTFFDDLAGEFDGIGVQMGQEDDKIVVIAPLEGSPAKDAGIRPKDIILAIDGVPTASLSLDEAVFRIRGKKGTETVLTIRHDGEDKSQEIKIKRGKITVKSLELSYKDLPNSKGKVAIIKISQFGDDTKSLFIDAVKDIEKQKPAGIILDLRNNPGGYLDTSIDIASYFVDKGPIVQEEDALGKKQERGVTHDAVLDSYPLVVLINEGSASASEIVAGAIQDRQEGKIIGQTSFGKGTVQDLISIAGGTLRLTTHKWLTPDGHEINKKGIKPDKEVEDNKDTIKDEQMEEAEKLLAEANN